MLLLYLTSFSVVYSLAAAFSLYSEFPTLVSWPAVAIKVDIICSHLPAEGCVQARTVAEVVPFWVELDADFSAIYSLWAHDAVSVWLDEELAESICHPQTWVHLRVSILLSFSLLLHRHLRPGAGGAVVIYSPIFHPSLKLFKLCHCSFLQIFQWRGVAQIQEHLYSLVDYIHYVYTERMASFEGLVILMLKAINVTRPCCHCSREGSFCFEIVPGQPHEVSCAVAEILGRGNHLYALIQELAWFLVGELVLAHGDQDLDPHWSLFCICWSWWWWRGEKQGHSFWRIGVRDCKDVAL